MKLAARAAYCLGILSAMVSAQVTPTFTFVEAGAQHGIGPYTMAGGMGAGLAAADYDDDGDIDLFVPNAGNIPDQLYRNLGNGVFEEIAAQVGLDSLDPNRAALWFDYDGDGDLDLAVANNACSLPCTPVPWLRLYRHRADGIFEEVTAAAGLAGAITFYDGMHVGGFSAADINNDGYLDLYLGYWEGQNYLFLNDGLGGFTDIATQAGIFSLRPYWQPVMHDFDGDGWMDILQAVDFTPNSLWINAQNNTFLDQAVPAGVDNAMNDMGVTLGDYDNDGDFDIYITEITRNGMHNVLYRNNTVGSNLSFSEVAASAGVDIGYWGWGTTFMDADNDGLLDLAATNGAWGQWVNDPSLFYFNQGGSPPTFSDVSTSVGFADTEWGSGLIALDCDRDGDLDMMQTCNNGPLRMLENQPIVGQTLGQYLVIKPRQAGPNNRAIGAVVRVTAGANTWSRLITAGTSFLSQEPAEAFVGMGTATAADTVRVDWPNGTQTTLANVPAGQVLTVTPGGYGDFDADGALGSGDVGSLVNCITGPGVSPGPDCGLADFNGDRDADLNDFSNFQ
ncbi:MAG: CRTAC1 family protein, partial [Phycisphaerae bacterium]